MQASGLNPTSLGSTRPQATRNLVLRKCSQTTQLQLICISPRLLKETRSIRWWRNWRCPMSPWQCHPWASLRGKGKFQEISQEPMGLRVITTAWRKLLEKATWRAYTMALIKQARFKAFQIPEASLLLTRHHPIWGKTAKKTLRMKKISQETEDSTWIPQKKTARSQMSL